MNQKLLHEARMSGRYHDYDKGSSRSTRDDSRTHKDRRWEGRSRDRSRSPRRRHSPAASARDSKYSPERSSRSHDKDQEEKIIAKAPQWELNSDSEEDVPAPPPPPRISKITMGFTKPKAPIKMSLGGPAKSTAAPKPTVASVFNEDDEDEPEQMPAEAKMRMRNIGRETPTSAGPNSFGKTKQGFCDAKKVFEKNLKQALDTAENKPTMTKFPQTIYKISGP